MNKIIKTSLLFYIMIVCCCNIACAEEKIVAMVNDSPIYMSSSWSVENCLLSSSDKEAYENLSSQEKEGYVQQVKSTWLQDMINVELQFQEAQKRDIQVSDDEIQSKLDIVMPKDKKDEILKEQRLLCNDPKLTWEELLQRCKEYLYKSLLIGKLKKQILSNVTVSDDEVEQYYNNNKDLYFTEREVISFSHYWFNDKETASDVLSAFLGNESSFPSIVEAWEFLKMNEDAGWKEETFMVKQVPPLYAELVVTMGKGDFSDVIEGDDGKYHFIEYYGVERIGEDVPYNMAKEQIEQVLLLKKLNSTYNDFLKKLNSEASIEIYN
jgi:parvulin-like peptidyl-prolyl isomerase